MRVYLKTAEEIEKLGRANQAVRKTLDEIELAVKPGVSTWQLNEVADRTLKKLGATSAFLGYHGYPAVLCTSVNHEVIHGIPNDRKLKAGDIVNIDIAIIKDGFHGDTSRMYFVGKPPAFAQRLAQVCKDAMWSAIDLVRPGAHLGDIGHAIQTLAEAEGFSVVREYCGHGIGRVYHEDPQILHYGEPGTGLEIRPGMVFTIEPMINAGKRHVRVLPDGWTVVTKDHSLSAQWEHMVLVTPTGHEIFGNRARGWNLAGN